MANLHTGTITKNTKEKKRKNEDKKDGQLGAFGMTKNTEKSWEDLG